MPIRSGRTTTELQRSGRPAGGTDLFRAPLSFVSFVTFVVAQAFIKADEPVRSRGGAMIRSRTGQRRLPPLQTGRADFPHPACPRTPRSKACVDRRRLGRRTETLPRNEVGRSLFWEQRSMCILTPFARRVLGRAPSLHGHYPASSLLRAPPTPDRAVARLWVPALVDASPKCESPLERVSQVPDDSVGIRRPLSPRRARPLQVFVASRSVTGFTLFWEAGHSHWV